MQVTGPADVDRWINAVETTIHELGLGVPHFGPGRFEVRFSPVDAVPVERVALNFETFISEEINRPFAKDDLPIRFWVMDREDGHTLFHRVLRPLDCRQPRDA